LDLVTAPVLCKALKDAGVSGLSGAEKAELMRLARETLETLSPLSLRMQFLYAFVGLPPQGRYDLTFTPR
jgi:hypothetical protein